MCVLYYSQKMTVTYLCLCFANDVTSLLFCSLSTAHSFDFIFILLKMPLAGACQALPGRLCNTTSDRLHGDTSSCFVVTKNDKIMVACFEVSAHPAASASSSYMFISWIRQQILKFVYVQLLFLKVIWYKHQEKLCVFQNLVISLSCIYS